MRNGNRFRLTRLSLGLALALAAAPVFAQSTSSALSGRISGADGQPVAGADVTIVHVESNSVSHATTDADGRYAARGLRVGGPYTITVAKDGVSKTQENVYLTLSETTTVDEVLAQAQAQAATTLAAVQVSGVGVGSDVFSPNAMGAGTTVTRRQIEALPSIKRSIEDYVRLDPRIVQVDKERGGISAGGQNNRYNNIKIDGVPSNDQFGLNDSGLPSTNQPISIDWIQEFNIGISDYDVTQSDFVGANINAVSKSGTNDFKGSVYGVYRDNGMLRKNEDGSKFAGFTDDWTAGAYVGGPLVRDRLFFFVGYEQVRRAEASQPKGIIGSGAPSIIGFTQDQLDNIIASATRLGLDNVNGAGIAAPGNNSDDKVFAKLDWNIADGQRLSLRYNKTDGTRTIFESTGNQLQLSSNTYELNQVFDNYAANLYSDWSDNFSTEANIAYSQYQAISKVASFLPSVTINTPSGAAPSGTVVFGTQRSRQANDLAVDSWNGYFAGDYFLGDHTLRFGGDYEKNDIYNLFLQDVYGNYTFSYENFTDPNFDNASIPYNSYRFQRPKSGGIGSVAANFAVGTLGLFVQDTWVVNNNLTVNYGFRVDRNLTDGTPPANAQARADFGVDNTNTIDGATTLEPRLGFNYTFDGDLRSQLRGGIGLFTGSSPGVWISNSFSNSGVVVDSFSASNGFGLNPDPTTQPTGALGSGATPVASSQVNFLSDGFKQPTVWKANLAFEQELGIADLVGGIEWLIADTRDGVAFYNLALGAANGTLPDGRQSFWSSTATSGFADPGKPSARTASNCILVNPALLFDRNTNPCRYTSAIELTNTGKGGSQNLTVFIEKPWKNNWTAKLAYTHGNTDEVSPATSSVAFSNWQNRIITNPNEEVSSTSNYEIRDRFTGSFSLRHDFFRNAPTTISLFYEGRSGRPFSYAYGNDANGDGVQGNDLLYVPLDNADVRFTSASSALDIAAFNAYIAGNDYLSTHRGQIAGRNAARSRFVNQFDLRLSQKLPLFAGTEGEIFLDVQNVGNLLNKKWGRIEQAGFPYTVQLARFAGVDGGQYVYDVSGYVKEASGGTPATTTLPSQPLQDAVGQSRWSAQIGFRFNF